MNNDSTTDCSSWNCCDEQLKSCIERSKYVSKTRRCLKEKKLRNKLKKLNG
ncbi:MAG: hypothetical protein ACXAB8_16320 [Promethearchaeota archaeon]|jgi:hypothetical protein